jgi:hypothetical protein
VPAYAAERDRVEAKVSHPGVDQEALAGPSGADWPKLN